MKKKIYPVEIYLTLKIFILEEIENGDVRLDYYIHVDERKWKKDKSYALKEKIFNDAVEEYNKKFLIDWGERI